MDEIKKDQPAALAPIVTGKAEVKKKSEGKKFVEQLFQGDLNTVQKSVLKDIILPSIRDTLWGVIERAVRGVIYGESEPDRRGDGRSIPARRVDYTRFSRDSRPSRDYDRDRDDILDFGEVCLEKRSDAEALFDQLRSFIDRYGWVSVMQVYELLGEKTKYTDRNWGWRDLRGTDIVNGRGCYILRLPRPKPLD